MSTIDRSDVTRRARARRVLIGETTNITIPAALFGRVCGGTAERLLLDEPGTVTVPVAVVGRLWAAADAVDDEAVDALVDAVDIDLLNACVTVAARGPVKPCGSGHRLDYGSAQPEPQGAP